MRGACRGAQEASTILGERVSCALAQPEHRSKQGFESASACPQVFEFLSTDLKKYMERTGKGPENPLDLDLVKVSPATPYARTAHLPLCTEAPSAC